MKFTLSTGNSAGRNSSGRITIFHRGGGSKRLHRKIDLKRSTSSMGIVERIEYDPNRSSRIALVRWKVGAHQRKGNTVEEFAPSKKRLESTTTTIRGPFAFSSLPGKVDQRKEACFSPGLMAVHGVVGLPTRMSSSCSKSHFTSKGAGSKKTCVKDVFFSALSPKAKGETASLSLGSSSSFPRIAVAGAKPPFFVFRKREEVREENTFPLCEIRKWKAHSILWAHRIKRKAALSWQSSGRQDTLGLVGAINGGPKNGMSKDDRAPITYIIASHQMEAGKMVMNCDWSKPSTSDSLRPAQNTY
ncbi:hypothetical protein ACJIZ3_019110 [Penstemon smallii]|uniref:60S ribosomal protein L2, mitochondrial n=1 Tax=Penstemon smallii TaxID=265156 RepID=A0ABD3T1H7_9LAMI